MTGGIFPENALDTKAYKEGGGEEIRDRFSSADLALIDACQGRRVKDIALDPYAESGQYKVLVTFETEEPQMRPSAEDRLAKVRADLERHGLDPFADKSRRMMSVAMRQCVFLMLRREGYTQKELGDATGYDHSTVSWGEAHARTLINIGDTMYNMVWSQINMIDEGML